MIPGLLATLSKSFSASARALGEEYWREHRVTVKTTSAAGTTAVVRGTLRYRVTLAKIDRDEWVGSCSCPVFDRGDRCKHLWALACQVERGDAPPLDERARSSDRDSRDQTTHPSGALAGRRKRPGFEGYLDHLDRMIEDLPRLARDDVPPDAPKREPEHDWRSRLADLRRETFVPSPGSGRPARLSYALARPRTPGICSAELHLFSSQAYKRGGWSAPRRFRLSPRDEQELDEIDRHALAMLVGAQAGFSYWELSSGTELPPQLQRHVLVPIARAGRLHFLSRIGTLDGEPLAWDDAGPWSFVVSLAREPADLTTLTAHLERAGERIPLADADLVLEGGLFFARGALREATWNGGWRIATNLRRQRSIRVPRSAEGELFDLVGFLPPSLPLDAPEIVQDVVGPPIPCLEIDAPDVGGAALGFRIRFLYGSHSIAPGSEIELMPTSTALQRIVRDTDAERAAMTELEHAGVRLERDRRSRTDGTISARDLPELVTRLTSTGWQVTAEGRPCRSGGSFSLSVRSGIDWFDLHAKLDFGGARAELPELLAALSEGRRMVRLSDDSFGCVPETWLHGWELAARTAKETDSGLRFEKRRAWMLDALLAERAVDVDRAFEEARARLARFRSPEPRVEPEGFTGELRAYQREGLGWLEFLRELGFGGCLADDMGLGKTVQVLAMLVERTREKRGPSLVVAPKSVVYNWQREAERFAPGLRVLAQIGTERGRDPRALAGHDLVITSYGTLRRDAEWLADVRFDYAILDEAQAIKNAGSQAAKAARLLTADHKLALTGTPIENHLGELGSLFEFLNPGLLGGAKAVAALLNSKHDVESAKRLAGALRPFFLRRTKEEVLKELPAKSEQTVVCELEGPERRAYDALRDHYRHELLARADKQGLERISMHVLEALLRLRQAACHPGLLDPKRTGEGSAKLDALLPMLEEVCEGGHKALVFSQFTSLLAIVRQRLDARGTVYEYLDGKTRKREECVRRFQEDESCKLFLISLKAGGFGLNLTAADYVFLLDPWWNPAVERQAIDRAHRIGQRRAVIAYRLAARDTIEDKVLELQAKKRALADALYQGSGTGLAEITRDDLEWMLS